LVTSVDFHPVQDLLFVTGCMDRTLRIWAVKANTDKPQYEVIESAHVSLTRAIIFLYFYICIFLKNYQKLIDTGDDYFCLFYTRWAYGCCWIMQRTSFVLFVFQRRAFIALFHSDGL
jgi:WD40 repeat protein